MPHIIEAVQRRARTQRVVRLTRTAVYAGHVRAWRVTPYGRGHFTKCYLTSTHMGPAHADATSRERHFVWQPHPVD